VRGLTQRNTFADGKQVRFAPGRYLGMRFDWVGRTTDTDSHTFGGARTMWASQLAIINGRHYYLLSSGPLAGYWVRDTAKVDPA
jgi:hypothetical protein